MSLQTATGEKILPIKVLLLENIHDSATQMFKSHEFEVKTLSGSLSEAQLIDAIQGVHIVGVRSKTLLTQKVLESSKNLLCIGCFCIGTNQVDLPTAKALGIPVFNAPFSNTRSVAELVISEIVMLARKLGDCVQAMHKKEWHKASLGCHEVRLKTLGIIGYGHIGSQLGVLAESFGMRVLFYDIAKKLPMGNNQAVPTMEQLLQTSDFVSLHVPATPETHGMFQRKEIDAMRPGSYLINASRGSVVNLQELAEAIQSGHIAGAAVDVYPQEPRKNGEAFECPLVGLSNVILTPHIGGSTEEAQASIGIEVTSACLSYSEHGTTSTAVNFPRIDLKHRQDTHRVLNIHKNIPGVMAKILTILSELDANIHAQYLATDDNIGYLITDLNQNISSKVLEALHRLPENIKSRILY